MFSSTSLAHQRANALPGRRRQAKKRMMSLVDIVRDAADGLAQGLPGAKKAKTPPKAKTPLKAKFKSFQERMMQKLTDQAAKAITGSITGVLVLLIAYRVISSRESVLADSRKEISRHEQERKQRQTYLRRSLAGRVVQPSRAFFFRKRFKALF